VFCSQQHTKYTITNITDDLYLLALVDTKSEFAAIKHCDLTIDSSNGCCAVYIRVHKMHKSCVRNCISPSYCRTPVWFKFQLGSRIRFHFNCAISISV